MMELVPESDNRSTNLIINYLPQGFTEQDLYKLFSSIGPLKSCKVIKDLKTGYSYGFGFVDFQKSEDARQAIAELNNLSLQHKNIKVSFARPAGEDIKETNVYVQNIPRCYTVEQFGELFTPFGIIVQKHLLKDKLTGASKGVGFVRYDKKSEANAAILEMNNKVPGGGTVPLFVRLAEEHGKAKSSYYAGYNAGVNSGGGGGGGGGFQNRNRGGHFRPMMGNGSGMPGYGRGNYSSFNPNIGKIPLGRSGRRYNPLSSGGMGSYSGFNQPYNFPPDVNF